MSPEALSCAPEPGVAYSFCPAASSNRFMLRTPPNASGPRYFQAGVDAPAPSFSPTTAVRLLFVALDTNTLPSV